MARLIVKLNSAVISEIELESGQQYIAGRALDAQIVLPAKRGISRHHLKFFEQNDTWVCEALSKFVPIQCGTESLEIIELNQSKTFSVPPFEFSFEPAVQKQTQEPVSSQSEGESSSPSADKAALRLPAPTDSSGFTDEDTTPRFGGGSDATIAGPGLQNLVPYIRISYPNSTEDEVLKLEGHLWVAGRDSSSEIPIESSHASRKHFELTRTNEGFYIVDLGSSNGTRVNGQLIPPHEPYRVDSGDEISIMNVTLEFEIRDTRFENRLNNLPVLSAVNPYLTMPPPEWAQQPMMIPGAVYESAGYPPQPKTKWEQYSKFLRNKNGKLNFVRVILAGLAPVVVMLAAMPDTKRKPASVSDKNKSPAYENLTKEQQSTIKDSFSLAKTLYVQGKYALCVAELAKVHDLVPQYENSKELQSFCEQGLELVRRQQDQERKRKEREALERQIANYVENCKNNLDPNASVDETRVCLADAMVLSPEHPGVVAMIHAAQQRQEEKKFLEARQKEQDEKAESGERHYQRVKRIAEGESLLKAIDAYEKFLSTSYPRIEDEKAKARRELASLKNELNTKVGFLLDQCKTLAAKDLYRDAYISCDKALEVDPRNAAAKDTRSRMESNLRKVMKVIYQDSVLEESLGNVDSAKEKWRRIVEQDLENGEYARKAKSKLRKYEGF